jgi:hypothetical protein
MNGSWHAGPNQITFNQDNGSEVNIWQKLRPQNDLQGVVGKRKSSLVLLHFKLGRPPPKLSEEPCCPNNTLV